jgi:hypothetical protein
MPVTHVHEAMHSLALFEVLYVGAQNVPGPLNNASSPHI